jgi:hypothetical protein
MDRHGSTLPQEPEATNRNGCLNKPANPFSSGLTDDDQFLLGAADERCRVGASRMAGLSKEAQRVNGFTLGTVAALAGKDTPYASKALDVEHPSLVLQLVAAIILLDKERVFLRGLARLAGGEYVDRPRLTPEQERDRLLETLRRHGSVGAAFIAEAFPEVAP